MAEVILMPRLSDTMTEGVIAAWHKKIGDPVKKGELLAEIETDKATMELESYKDGTLLHVGANKGGKIQVNDLLAIIGNAGEDISQHLAESGKKADQPVQENKTATKTNAPQVTPAARAADQKPGMDISKMEEVVLMPRLSDTMTEGVIAGWHKNVGDAVKKGDVLADIETDKATMELESYKNGTLLFQGAKQGEKIAVNDLLCIIGEEGKVDVNAIVAAAKGNSSAPAGGEARKEEGKSSTQISETTSAPTSESGTEDGRIKASPLAKKIARDKGINLSQVKGTGDNGRITKTDVDNFVPQQQGGSPAAASGQPKTQAPAQVFTGEEGYQDLDVSQMRKVIAKRLGESKFSAPHFYLTMEINMDNAMKARAEMNEVSEVKISFNDMIVKASAMALRKHPAVNASWMGDVIRRYNHIHVGIAVSIEDGLIVPVVRFADQKGLSQIAAESKDLAGRARNKKLQPNEFTGNTFTVSNLGMMDIEEFTAIINPPDSAIMAVGRIKEIVVKKEEGFGVSNVMKITLSCDHRSVDGAVGAAFLQTFKKYMENPVTMLV
jgi:pyruvate dehydrogenase E2 component (dihydrolipoamide acetyltransferase)